MNVLKVLLAAALLQAPAAPPVQSLKTGLIEGIVLGSAGEPLANVNVSLTTGLSSFEFDSRYRIVTSKLSASLVEALLFRDSVTTGSDGRFAFDGLGPGNYHVTAERPGYVRTEYGQRGPSGKGQPMTLNEGEKRRDVRLFMIATGTITGRIVDGNGDPIIGARVQALKYTYSEQGRSLAPVATVITDDSGEYRLFWLPPDSYIVSAKLPPRPTSPLTDGSAKYGDVLRMIESGQVVVSNSSTIMNRTLEDGTNIDETNVPVFYPGVSSWDNAVAVSVRGGSTTSGANMTMAPVRVFKIRGRTVNADSGQLDSSHVTLVPKSLLNGPFAEGQIEVVSTGSFEIPGVVPGSYFLLPEQPFGGTPLLVEVGNSDVNNIVVPIILPTSPGRTAIQGRIMIDGVTRPLTNTDTVRRVNLSPVVGPLERTFIPVAADGTFAIKGGLPGDYRVSVQGEPGYFVKSIRLGNQEAIGNIVNLSYSTAGTLDIVLTAARGKLEGRVLNERREPVTNGGTVVLVPDAPLRARSDLYSVLILNEAGKFRGEAMPGRYQIFAWEDIVPNAWLDADYMKSYENRGRSVNIVDGGNENLDIEIIPYAP